MGKRKDLARLAGLRRSAIRKVGEEMDAVSEKQGNQVIVSVDSEIYEYVYALLSHGTYTVERATRGRILIKW